MKWFDSNYSNLNPHNPPQLPIFIDRNSVTVSYLLKERSAILVVGVVLKSDLAKARQVIGQIMEWRWSRMGMLWGTRSRVTNKKRIKIDFLSKKKVARERKKNEH